MSEELNDPTTAAAQALTDLSLPLAEQMNATEKVLDARERIAGALAKVAHPTSPLRKIEGGRR